MTLPSIGSTVQASLGDKIVDVKVTAQNQKMLEDGDLTNDLEQIKKSDGDGATLSIADVKASFDVNQAQHIFNVASGVKLTTFDPKSLGSDSNNLISIMKSKTYLPGTSPTTWPTPGAMTNFLNKQTITERNGIVAELSNETAMLHVRDDLNADLNTKPSGSTWTFKSLISTLDTGTVANVMKNMGGDTPANRQLLADKIMTHPDMSLGEKHALLDKLGFKDIKANNTAIAAAMAPIHAKIETVAKDFYAKLGGTGDMPETIALATGDGSTTKGLAATDNLGIGLMHYGDAGSKTVNASNITNSKVGGVATATKTFTPTSHTKPVSFHFSATGANFGTSSLSIQHDGKTYAFNITTSGNNTVLSPAPGMKLPPGVSLDPSKRTLTFPPSSTPFTLTQSSAGNVSEFDEIFTSVSVSNASSSTGNISMNLNGVFVPDGFGITFDQLSADQQQQMTELAGYLKEHPDQKLTINATGKGPTWWDGSRPTETGGYGKTEETGTTRAQLLALRSTDVTSDMKTGTLTVSSTTDPVKSGLDGHLSVKGKAAFTKFMTNHPGLVKNDVLSGCRAFATLEMMQKKFSELGVPQKILDDNTVVQLPNNQTMTYAEFKAIKQP